MQMGPTNGQGPLTCPDPMPETNLTSPASQAAALEAARFALLRRLAPALRHEAVAHLQPLTMVGSILERRLAAPQPDTAQVADGVRRLMASSRGAVQSCLDVLTWLAPEPGRLLPLHEAVAETLQLLRGSLGFRGFAVRDEVGGLAAPVPRAALRYVLPASLLWLTDSAGPPAEVTLTARTEGVQVSLVLELAPTDGPEGAPMDPAGRALAVAEVALLARADGVGFTQQGDAITLTLAAAS